MEIVYLGHSSFRIKTKTATIVTDPYPAEVGFKFSKTEADIVTVSHQHFDHNAVSQVGGEPFIIDFPGEFEVKDISFFGFSSVHGGLKPEEKVQNTIYLIEGEGLRICHLGDLGVVPADKVKEEIIGVDVLMVPVGGEFTLGPKEAVEVINQIEPLIVLPMHYKAPGMAASFNVLSDLQEFLGQIGAVQTEKIDKLTLSKDKLPTEMKVVVLERKN